MTKVSMPIIGWVSEILGWMINVIYSTDLLILLHHRILVFFTIIFLLDLLDLRLHNSI